MAPTGELPHMPGESEVYPKAQQFTGAYFIWLIIASLKGKQQKTESFEGGIGCTTSHLCQNSSGKLKWESLVQLISPNGPGKARKEPWLCAAPCPGWNAELQSCPQGMSQKSEGLEQNVTLVCSKYFFSRYPDMNFIFCIKTVGSWFIAYNNP